MLTRPRVATCGHRASTPSQESRDYPGPGTKGQVLGPNQHPWDTDGQGLTHHHLRGTRGDLRNSHQTSLGANSAHAVGGAEVAVRTSLRVAQNSRADQTSVRCPWLGAAQASPGDSSQMMTGQAEPVVPHVEYQWMGAPMIGSRRSIELDIRCPWSSSTWRGHRTSSTPELTPNRPELTRTDPNLPEMIRTTNRPELTLTDPNIPRVIQTTKRPKLTLNRP